MGQSVAVAQCGNRLWFVVLSDARLTGSIARVASAVPYSLEKHATLRWFCFYIGGTPANRGTTGSGEYWNAVRLLVCLPCRFEHAAHEPECQTIIPPSPCSRHTHCGNCLMPSSYVFNSRGQLAPPFFSWLGIGVGIYILYSRPHSNVGKQIRRQNV